MGSPHGAAVVARLLPRAVCPVWAVARTCFKLHNHLTEQFCTKLQKRFLEHPVTEMKLDKVRTPPAAAPWYC
jgi:hypothetical protein